MGAERRRSGKETPGEVQGRKTNAAAARSKGPSMEGKEKKPKARAGAVKPSSPARKRPPASTANQTAVRPLVHGRRKQMDEKSLTIIETIQDGYFELDLAGNFTFVNKALSRNIGYPKEELIGLNYRRYTDPANARILFHKCHQLFLTGKPVGVFDCEVIRKDGQSAFAEVSLSLIRDAKGKPTGFRGTSRDVTERRKIIEELRKSEERHRTILDNIQEGYFENDLKGDITFVNDAACKYLGYAREELIGRSSRIYQDEAGWRKTLKAYQNLYKTGIPIKVLESELIRKDGSRGIFELSADLMRDAQGKPVGFRGIARDITERKQMENELRQSEERYRNIIETIQDAYIEIDLSGRWTFVNHVACEHLLYSRDELIGVHYSKMQPDEASVKRLFRIFNTIYQTGQPVKALEMAGVRKDGTTGCFEFSVSLIRDPDGHPTGFRCVSRDITERKKMETELRQSEERYRSVIETMADGYIEVDLRGNWTFFNDVVARRMGYTREELMKADFHTLHTPESAKRAVKAFLQVYQTGQPIKALEVETVKKDGSTGFYELSVSLMKDVNGRPAGFRCISRDINERKKAEALLIRTNQELQEAIARANELTAQAEAASIAKSEFLANMSHEIRTPMNGVIGMIGLLLDMELSEEQRRYAEIVRANGELLLELINNILDFSKIEAKKLHLETLDFDLLTLLDDFVSTMALPAQEKGLELLCSVDLDVPTLLRGDPGRLRQILTNLVGNAVKFTRTGEVVVYVSLAEETRRQNEQSIATECPGDVLLHFSVRDTGIGIPKEKTGLLFGKFSQLDASTTRQYGGSGLGLVISKQLSELFGGEIGVISEEGKGSEFWFTARLALQIGVQPAACAPVDLKDVRVLIVDDNATNREILAKRLSSWGMRPSEAKDGSQALQVFHQVLEENDPFRMALIDMQMPNMDGETLGKIIKMNPRLADTRLVLLTSLGTRGDVRRFHTEDFSACVTKPIRYQEFRDILSMVLGAPLEAGGRHIVAQQRVRETPGLFVGRKVRILVAEDNITNQQVALGLLKNLGLSANAVANGLEVLKALETIPYDLVFMDVQMPELDGFEATRRVRSWKEEPEGYTGHSRAEFRKRASSIPIIAMTAYALEGDRDRCLEAGMNDYISKPVSRKALVEALEKWLPKEDAALAGAGDSISGARDKKSGNGHIFKVFNREDLVDRMGEERLARTVALRFAENIDGLIQALKDSLKSGDIHAAHRMAHSIKGAAANVGGEALCDVALKMEEAGMEGRLSDIEDHLTELEQQCVQLLEAISKTYRLA